MLRALRLEVLLGRCFSEDDRRILQHKVGQYYTGASLEESCANFARFVQVSAIGLIASHMAEYMSAWARVGCCRRAFKLWIWTLRGAVSAVETKSVIV